MSTGTRPSGTEAELPPALALHRPGVRDGAGLRGRRVGALLVGAPGSRRRRYARRLRLPALVLLVLAVLGAGVWVVGVSPVLDVRTVTVEGTASLTPAQVSAAAQVPLGVPLVRLDTTAIADRVAALPAVRTVSVTRHLPHTVVIAVTERTPAALIVGDSGVVRVVDATGAIYPPPGAVPTDLPVLVDSGVALDVAAVQSAVTVLAALPAAINAEVSAVVVADDDAVVLDLEPASRQQTVVRWGTAADTPLKVRVLSALLKVSHDRWLDVSAPEVPVTRASIPAGTLPQIPAVGRAAR